MAATRSSSCRSRSSATCPRASRRRVPRARARDFGQRVVWAIAARARRRGPRRRAVRARLVVRRGVARGDGAGRSALGAHFRGPARVARSRRRDEPDRVVSTGSSSRAVPREDRRRGARTAQRPRAVGRHPRVVGGGRVLRRDSRLPLARRELWPARDAPERGAPVRPDPARARLWWREAARAAAGHVRALPRALRAGAARTHPQRGDARGLARSGWSGWTRSRTRTSSTSVGDRRGDVSAAADRAILVLARERPRHRSTPRSVDRGRAGR